MKYGAGTVFAYENGKAVGHGHDVDFSDILFQNVVCLGLKGGSQNEAQKAFQDSCLFHALIIAQIALKEKV